MSELKKAIELVKARKAELAKIGKDKLTAEQLEEAYEIGLYKRPKETTRAVIGRLAFSVGKATNGTIDLPDIETIFSKGKDSFGSKSEEHVKKQTETSLVCLSAFLAELRSKGYKITK